MSYSDNEPTVTAMERVIRRRDDLQFRLLAAEGIAKLATEQVEWLQAKNKRAEAVVEAAKKTVDKHCCWEGIPNACKYHGKLAAAIRRYEEGK